MYLTDELVGGNAICTAPFIVILDLPNISHAFFPASSLVTSILISALFLAQYCTSSSPS
jgi:hypothetical protein